MNGQGLDAFLEGWFQLSSSQYNWVLEQLGMGILYLSDFKDFNV